MSYQIQIVTPTKVLKKTTADEIFIPAEWGRMQILPQHADYIGQLTAGELKYKNRATGQEESYNITGGLIALSGRDVKILVDGLQS